MPAGLDYSSAASYAAFAGVKLVAYSAYAVSLRKRFDPDRLRSRPFSSIAVGATRTAIGMVVGGTIFALSFLVAGAPPQEVVGFLAYWACLFPIRLIEWRLLLRIFFPDVRTPEEYRRPILGGTVISYVADLPATVSWAFAGGLWIC